MIIKVNLINLKNKKFKKLIHKGYKNENFKNNTYNFVIFCIF